MQRTIYHILPIDRTARAGLGKSVKSNKPKHKSKKTIEKSTDTYIKFVTNDNRIFYFGGYDSNNNIKLVPITDAVSIKNEHCLSICAKYAFQFADIKIYNKSDIMQTIYKLGQSQLKEQEIKPK